MFVRVPYFSWCLPPKKIWFFTKVLWGRRGGKSVASQSVHPLIRWGNIHVIPHFEDHATIIASFLLEVFHAEGTTTTASRTKADHPGYQTYFSGWPQGMGWARSPSDSRDCCGCNGLSNSDGLSWNSSHVMRVSILVGCM